MIRTLIDGKPYSCTYRQLLSRAAAYVVVHVPGVDLLARGLDFFVSDPLHHYMEVGMLNGIKERAEGRLVAA